MSSFSGVTSSCSTRLKSDRRTARADRRDARNAHCPDDVEAGHTGRGTSATRTDHLPAQTWMSPVL